MERSAVFIHGDTQNHTVFKNIFACFAYQKYRTIEIDLPGHGETPFSAMTNNHQQFVRERIPEKGVTFIAHSSGAAIVALLIEEGYMPDSLVLINPLLTKLSECNHSINFPQLCKKYVDDSYRNFQKQELVDYTLIPYSDQNIYTTGIKHTDPKALAYNFDLFLDFPSIEKIYDLSIPIIYLAGMNDHFMTQEYHKTQCARLKNVKFFPLEAGHHPLLTHSKEIEEIIMQSIAYLGERT